MTTGIGGSRIEDELAAMTPRRGVEPIAVDELHARISKAQALLRESDLCALYLDASTSAYYFTGVRLSPSERLHGVVIPARGEIVHVAPAFEEASLRERLRVGNDVRTWEEDEDPTSLVIDTIRANGYRAGGIAVDEATRYFTFDGLSRAAGGDFGFVNGSSITGPCRMIKSAGEIALIQAAMDITLEVQRATAAILEEGMTTLDVADFITRAHLALGSDGPPTFAIVLFGEPTAYPHGVDYPQQLAPGDMVLIDTGATVEGYHSDITRSYVFGEPTARQREIWNLEKAAQAAAFAAAQPGTACEEVDAAARRVIEAHGFGPGYQLPGLPHRTGHGIGLDGHEWTYLVKGNKTPLAPGMCFSNEPMICIYGEFGVRLEDHFYVTEDGPVWFTHPSPAIDEPFA